MHTRFACRHRRRCWMRKFESLPKHGGAVVKYTKTSRHPRREPGPPLKPHPYESVEEFLAAVADGRACNYDSHHAITKQLRQGVQTRCPYCRQQLKPQSICTSAVSCIASPMCAAARAVSSSRREHASSCIQNPRTLLHPHRPPLSPSRSPTTEPSVTPPRKYERCRARHSRRI